MSPNGGEDWQQGTVQTIRWSYLGDPGSTVKIEVLKGSTIMKTAYLPIAAGSASFRLPLNMPFGDDFRVRVTSTSHDVYTDVSDNFTISGPSLSVLIPNAAETYQLGDPLPMSWSFTGSPGSVVTIEVLKGPAILKTLTGIPAGSGGYGSYSVRIPYTTPLGSDYRIRVSDPGYPGCTDTSDENFTIASPTITVLTPSNGDNYARGSPLSMTWTYTGNPGPTVTIDVLKGTGILKTLASVPTGSGGHGSYNVTVPAGTPVGSDYMIRVTSGSYAACTDTSNGMFTISATG